MADSRKKGTKDTKNYITHSTANNKPLNISQPHSETKTANDRYDNNTGDGKHSTLHKK